MKRISRVPAARLLVGIGALVLAAGTAGCASPTPVDPAQSPTPQSTAARPTTQPGGMPGVTGERILFGQSAAFSGPAEELGWNMQLGIEAAFREANEAGGVHGRRLELHSLDDAYEPEAAIANTHQLIEQEQVFALIGAVGTPTSRSATPIATDARVPYIAPFTGAAFLRAPELVNVINMRASYYQETEEMVARLTSDLGVQRIAVVYQDDSFGRAGYRGADQALERRGMRPTGVGLYPRNTTAVKTAVLDIREGDPEAVIIIGAYRPVAAVIAWARHIGLDPVFMTVSFVGSNALAEELGPGGAGVFVTQVVPFPSDETRSIIMAYQRALAAHSPDSTPGFVSLEGYLAGRLAVVGLDRCGREVNRDCFLTGVRNTGPIDIDGFELRYGDGDNQGSDTVFLTTIGSDGQHHPVGRLQDAEFWITD